MADYLEDVVVLAQLCQDAAVMDPATGDIIAHPSRAMPGLSKAQLVDYGGDWLDVMLADYPSTLLARIEQVAMLTSEQAPGITDRLVGTAAPRFYPIREAVRRAKDELVRMSRVKRWGGSR